MSVEIGNLRSDRQIPELTFETAKVEVVCM